MKLKVMTIVGTRPEIIRLSRTIALLDQFADQILVHTGQNYDYQLNEVFFSDLGVRQPDHFMGVDTSSLGRVMGGVLIETEALIRKHRQDCLLILGDTNSAISAIMARRMKVPIFHMEAGNRSFDRNVPEETNRRLVDHASDFNLVYTEHARRNLLAEGIHPRRIYLTGSPMREVLDHYLDRIQGSDVLARLGLEKGRYFIASLHREENVDSKDRLRSLVGTLNALVEAFGFPLILSTHPRTRKRLDSLADVSLDPRISDLEPFGFHDYINLQMNAFCAISDSGTIAEESAILDFPAITPRDAIERPEAMDAGGILVTGLHRETIIDAVEAATRLHGDRKARGGAAELPAEYAVANTSERVVKLILGTARLSNDWDGVRTHDYL